MAMLSNEQAVTVVHDSLAALWDFGVPRQDPKFPDEEIRWPDLLALPPVTKTYLYYQTLVAAYLLDRQNHKPSMNQRKFFEHVDTTASEDVRTYAGFIVSWLTV